MKVQSISVSETVTVTASSDTVFNSERTGAATAVTRESIALMPTVSNRLDSVVTHDAPGQRRPVVRRPGQPDEQHHG